MDDWPGFIPTALGAVIFARPLRSTAAFLLGINVTAITGMIFHVGPF
jgi:hypothetical protein